jgi:hypothetical protein
MEHKDNIECMHCDRSKYVKVINKDGASVTTKMPVKQLCYIPITPRLKRLFLCEETAQQMWWHKEGICDSEDRFDPEFARDSRSVRLSLSMDGFHPYSSDSTVYSCWSVSVMLYNLPPNKCLKEGLIFFALVILGPKEQKKQINIFLRSLMEELKELWQGVDAYDSHLKCRFNLCGAYL